MGQFSWPLTPISIFSVTQPANGTVVITSGGTGLTYAPNPNYCNNPPGTTLDTFTYTLTPGGSTATVTVTVTCLNDAPVLDLPGPGVNYDTITPIILDATATVTDIDSPNFDTGVLTANVTTACDVNDRLGVRNEGIGPNQIGVSGADVTYNPGTGAVTIGTIATEFDCTTPAVPTLAITLNADADLTATQALLRNLVFFSASATPPPTQRTVEAVLTDGDSGTSNTATKSVDLDAAPTVNTIGPANNATGVAIGADVVITFSEAVTVTGNWFQITCPTSSNRSALSGTAVTGGPAVFTINPTVDFANGETCTVTVTALQVADQDTLDPPDNMATDFNSTFTTVDIAPTATAGTAPGTIANNATITLNFSEAVNIAAGGITWACAPGFTPALPQNSVTTITLTPTGALPNGTACNVTLESTLITDVDAVDPPNQLDGNNSSDIIDGDADDQVFVYTVDAAPAFTGSTPINGAIDFLPGANLVVNFSEAVNVSTDSFTINCGAGNYEVTGTGTTAITLDPTADLPGGTGCTVTGVPAQINDSDSIDPPANPAAFSFSFTTASVANDDSYNVTPHLTLSSAAGATEVDVNDQLGTGTITGFGFGACTGTAPGAQLDAGVANGRFTLNADGSFSYEPPAGVANTTRTFCYTVSGGDTANIVFTLQNTELVWFVDAAAAPGGAGNQARPFQTLAAAAAVDTPADTLHIADGNYTCGITLANNERVLGDGSTQGLADFTGITPVTGSAFPTLSGTAPVLTATNVNCLALDATAGNTHTLRGFIIGDTGATGTDIAGTDFGTLTVNEVTLNGTGRALNLTNGTFNATFASVSSSNGANNVSLTNVAGTSNFGGGALSGATSHAFNVDGGAGNFTYAGSITNTAAARLVNITNKVGGGVTLSGALSGTSSSTGVNIANNSGGTIALTNASKVLTTATNPAVTLATNTGTTINFTGGGLAISTTSGTGFSATGGGTINVTGTNNSITTTAGAAINVANTTIGASDLNFRSITSTNAAADAISLSSTGTTGGLKVGAELPGTPAAGNGGTITNPGDNAISLVNTSNNFFRGLLVNGTGGHGVLGTGMTDGSGGTEATLEFRNSRFTSPGDGDNETALFFGSVTSPGNSTGKILVADTVVELYEEHGIEVYNNTGSITLEVTGTLSGLTDSTTKFDDNNDTHGQQGILMTAAGTASTVCNVSGVFFNNIESATLDARAEGASATLDVNWIGNVSINGGGPDNFPSGGGFQIVQDKGGTATFDIQGNTIRDLQGDGVVIIADGPSEGRIGGSNVADGNVISGSLVGDGIRIDTDQLPGEGNNFLARILIQNNSIGSDASFPGIGDDGIQILHRDGTKTLNLTIDNNTIANTASEAIRYFQDADVSDGALKPYGAVRVAGNTMSNIGVADAFVFQTQETADLDLHVTGNIFPAAGNRNISLSQAGTSVFQITQASVVALAAANPNSTASVAAGTITFNSSVTNPPLPANP